MVGECKVLCHWGIASALWHDGPLVEAPQFPYGSEVNVIGMYAGLEKGVGHVHLG